jgi:hypothetical protein
MNQIPPEFQTVASEIYSLANRYQNEPAQLLALLRTLEKVHRDIQEGDFQNVLPQTRRDLYDFLRNMEEEGGWPYIPRRQLQSLLSKLRDS